MSKLPSSAHRSASVRQQPQQPLPRLRKSASAYGIADRTAHTPVEIGSQGSIFSLVNRDITACVRSPDSSVVSPSKKRWSYVWHSRLWVMPTRKANASGKHKLVGVETVVESARETKTPKWKRLLKKLTRGSTRSKGDGSVKIGEKMRAMQRDDTSRRDATIPVFMPPQTSDASTSLIWERRSFAQITPLDLSHLYTTRIKKEHLRPH